MKLLTEKLTMENIIAPQDVGTADVTGTYKDVSGVRRFAVLAKAGAVTAAKILTVQLMQATTSGGANAKVLGAAATAAGAGGNPPADVLIEKNTAQLDSANGFKYVTAVLSIDENAKLGSAWLIRGEKRYT